MPAGMTETDSMFSVRETPWHRLGKVLDKAPKGIDDALEKSGTAWGVLQRPLYFQMPGAKDNEFTEVRRPGADEATAFVNVREDTGGVLGVVTDKYRVLQNREAFSWLGNLIGTDLLFETAGSLHGGKHVWVMTRLPDYVEIGGDKTGMFVFITNSHDGGRAVKAAVSPVRIVCQNTLTWALSEAQRTYSIAHIGDPQQRLIEARNVLGVTIDYAKQFKVLGDRLATEKMAEAKLKKVLEELYPTSGPGMTDRKIANREEARASIVQLFKEGKTQGNAPGTKWCAVNAISEYVDWGTDTNEQDAKEATLTRAMTDPTNIKKRAFELIAN